MLRNVELSVQNRFREKKEEKKQEKKEKKTEKELQCYAYNKRCFETRTKKYTYLPGSTLLYRVTKEIQNII